jgi:ABC-type polysaccharide/polyol phosphate export permease
MKPERRRSCYVNPLFYVVSTVRYGILGTADVAPAVAFAVAAAMSVAMLTWSQYLCTSEKKLKP